MAAVPITGHKAGSGLPTQLRRKPLQAAWRTVQSVLNSTNSGRHLTPQPSAHTRAHQCDIKAFLGNPHPTVDTPPSWLIKQS